MEKKEVAAVAAGPEPDKADSHGKARMRVGSSDCDQIDGDFISKLPDAMLGTIISLLPTKDGFCTQALSRRWRPLWRSAPLNLEVVNSLSPHALSSAVPVSAVPKIISLHDGPARRFCFLDLYGSAICSEVEGWFRSRALAGLQELDLVRLRGLTLSWLTSASTLLVVKISHADFSTNIGTSINFAVLKQLTLRDVSISSHVFHTLLSGCHALQSLYICNISAVRGSLRLISPTLRCIGFRDIRNPEYELVIEDAPSLERLLMPSFSKDCCQTIRVLGAPKLEILGAFSPVFSKLFFQGMSPVSPANSMCSVKVLALRSSGRELPKVLNALGWFPCLEKLYVIFYKHAEVDREDEPHYDTLHPVKCLQTHLKDVVFESFLSNDKQIDFARFFILNAQVLNKIEFEGFAKFRDESVVTAHCKLLQVENRASRDAKFEFRMNHFLIDHIVDRHIHNLAVADPFRRPIPSEGQIPEDGTIL